MKALSGMRVVVTRAAHQAEELARPLRELGAEVLIFPAIAIAPPDDPQPLRAAAAADNYDWVLFTSANAVSAFAEVLRSMGRQCLAPVAAVGSATAIAAQEYGFRVRLVPEHYVAESLIEAFAGNNVAGRRILIPSAAKTRDVVAPALRVRGAQVDVVVAYQNVAPPELGEQAQAVFRPPFPDWVVFASPSAVTNLVQAIGSDVLRSTKIASVGPVTSEAIRNHGLSIAVEAKVHTVEGLIEAIVSA
jgi:uroporphyrinogen-III synthase